MKNHSFFVFLAAFVAIAAASCSSDKTGWGSNLWGPNASASGAQDVKNAMVKDVLGGALTTAIDPQEFAYDSIEKKATSVNVAFSTTTSEMDGTYTFTGADGIDSLTINVSGEVDEVTTEETESSVLNFSQLQILIHFDGFVFANACNVQATLIGDVECKVSGTYNRASESFKGNAMCSSGTIIHPLDMTYLLGQDEHKVRFSVNVKIDGNAFDLDSYIFNGSFFIDNRIVPIANIVSDNLSCDALVN